MNPFDPMDQDEIVNDNLTDDDLIMDEDLLFDDILMVDVDPDGNTATIEKIDTREEKEDKNAPWLVKGVNDALTRQLFIAKGLSQQIVTTNTTAPLQHVDVGVATWNINHLNPLQTDKHASKTATIIRFFKQNPWLDVLVLQEINQVSIQSLHQLELQKQGLILALGPKMTSIGAKGGLGQHEYYPIVYRAGSLKYEGCWAFHGGKWIRNTKGSEDEEIYWTKPEHKSKSRKKSNELKGKSKKRKGLRNPNDYEDYRPVVVHRLAMGSQTVYVGVVHTTPKGKHLSRAPEYKQVKSILEIAKQRSTAGNEHWIIAGDYYLDPESLVRPKKESEPKVRAKQFETVIDEHGLQIVIPISATNQSVLARNHPQDEEDSDEEDEIGKEERRKLSEIIGGVVTSNQRPGNLRREVEGALREVPRAKRSKFDSENALADRIVLVDSGLDKEASVKLVLNKRADFFICTPTLKFCWAGLVSPCGGLLLVDPNHHALNWWAKVSDHAPIGGIFSNRTVSTKFEKWKEQHKSDYFEQLEDAEKEIQKLKSRAFMQLMDFLEELAKAYQKQKQDMSPEWCNLARKVCSIMAGILLQADFELSYISAPIPGDTGSSDEEWAKARTYIYETVFDEDAPRWNPSKTTPESILAEAARSIHRCLAVLSYSIESFDVTDEKDDYVDVDSKRN